MPHFRAEGRRHWGPVSTEDRVAVTRLTGLAQRSHFLPSHTQFRTLASCSEPPACPPVGQHRRRSGQCGLRSDGGSGWMGGRMDRDQVGQGSFPGWTGRQTDTGRCVGGGTCPGPQFSCLWLEVPWGVPRRPRLLWGPTLVPFCSGDIVPWRLCLGQRRSPWSTPVPYATPRMCHCQDLTVCPVPRAPASLSVCSPQISEQTPPPHH